MYNEHSHQFWFQLTTHFWRRKKNVKSLQIPTNAKWYILIRAITNAWKSTLQNNLQTSHFFRIKCCFFALTKMRTISDIRDITQVFKTRQNRFISHIRVNGNNFFYLFDFNVFLSFNIHIFHTFPHCLIYFW